MGISRWQKVPLKTLCNRIGDGLHGTPKYSDNSDIFFVNGNNLVNGKILVSKDTKKVPDFEWRDNFVELNKNSLLLSINGTIGQMAFYNDEKIMLGKSIAYLNFKTGINVFYYYYFQLTNIQKYFYQVATGSTIKNLGLKSIQEFEVPYPNIKSWEPITSILCELDKKIKINNKINSELEAMAKLIYDYWFVQFDFPDENGKPYKSSGGKMTYNKELKREIPEGWSAKELGEIEPNIITGKTPSKANPENFGGEVPFICIGDVRGNMHVTETEETLSKLGADSQSKKYVPKGAICVTCIATPGLVGFATEDSQTNQQLNTIICDDLKNRYFLYFYIKDYFRFAKAKSGNTFANMNKDDFSSINIIHPRKDILERFNDTLDSSIEKILLNSKENNKLRNLRDWLLPMLMNGQVKIK